VCRRSCGSALVVSGLSDAHSLCAEVRYDRMMMRVSAGADVWLVAQERADRSETRCVDMRSEPAQPGWGCSGCVVCWSTGDVGWQTGGDAGPSRCEAMGVGVDVSPGSVECQVSGC